MVYYNEIDVYAAQWLRNLIAAGHIARGIVDTRSIVDVKPGDLAGFRQCHFFAGVGVWSLALRRAGVPDDADVWTGSCPCQPFSSAGAGAGMDDQRHLWPHFEYLIGKRRPAKVFGEQVASRDAEPWLDLVHTDMEALGYAFGAVAFPSAGVGAPHIRDRTYWVAHADHQRLDRQHPLLRPSETRREQAAFSQAVWGGSVDRLGDAHYQGLEGHAGDGGHARRRGASGSIAAASVSGGMGHADSIGAGRDRRAVRGEVQSLNGEHGAHDANPPSATSGVGNPYDSAQPAQRSFCGGPNADADRSATHGAAGPTNGLWRDADWLLCRDGKWRPVEPGTFPLAHGATSRVGRLRAYGNAINVEAARVFIESTL